MNGVSKAIVQRLDNVLFVRIQPKNRRVRKIVGRVYYIEALGASRIKIGFTTNPARRLKTLQNASPFPLKLLVTELGTVKRERELHKQFAGERVLKNAEWFNASSELRKHIESVKQAKLSRIKAKLSGRKLRAR